MNFDGTDGLRMADHMANILSSLPKAYASNFETCKFDKESNRPDSIGFFREN